MKTKEKEFVRTTVDLPNDLNAKLCAEAEKEKRSRHAQIIYALGKYFEPRNESGKREKTK